MKILLSTKTLALIALANVLGATPGRAQQGGGRGMPPEAREQIHTLFANHSAIHREVSVTADGYTALTESGDARVAAALKKHVAQMRARLEAGLSVRRWDPAFAEYVDHYRDLEHQFTATDKGVRMTVKGRTAKAVKVAQNHAKIVSAFAAHGWTEHDQRHKTATE